VQEHRREEQRVEVWDGGGGPDNKGPGENLEPVGGVVGLADDAPPAVDEQLVTAKS